MEHISYEEYTQYGGIASIEDFPILLLDVETYLRKFTANRIDDYELDTQIKRLITLLVNKNHAISNTINQSGISSYSDGIETISYDTEQFTPQAKEDAMRDLCRTYLPQDLLYRGRSGFNGRKYNNL